LRTALSPSKLPLTILRLMVVDDLKLNRNWCDRLLQRQPFAGLSKLDYLHRAVDL
jgi:hypothetical protein